MNGSGMQTKLHVDASSKGPSLVTAFGDFTGGGLCWRQPMLDHLVAGLRNEKGNLASAQDQD